MNCCTSDSRSLLILSCPPGAVTIKIFQGLKSYPVLIADYSKGIQSQQSQGDITNSGCLFARYLKYLYENAEKAMSRIKGRGDIAACI